ncbi:MAG: glycoside hydrolase [Candidatus Marinimicrobia bacterium]|nr:glycoside hydrolase [Candidatus Neomarinimicrobiota bacterium]
MNTPQYPGHPLKLGIVLVLLIVSFGCQSNADADISFVPANFPNVLEVRNLPAGADDWSAFCHSDQGAWFGFGLPPVDRPTFVGSFTGPFLMSQGRWLAPSILQLQLKDADGEIIDLKTAADVTLTYYPGRLEQEFSLAELNFKLELIFADQSKSLALLSIKNLLEKTVNITLGWKGQAFDSVQAISQLDQSIVLPLSDDEYFGISFPDKYEISVEIAHGEYSVWCDKPVTIGSGMVTESTVKLSQLLTDERAKPPVILEVNDAFIANNTRWTNYLNSALQSTAPWRAESDYQRVAVKSVMTLINNWKGPRGDLHFGGLFPSYAVWYFNGFWAWDSWKHAVALATFAPEIAKDQIRVMFDWQDEAGMVPDVIYADSMENNNRDTKPPLAAWAVWSVYAADGDIEFLEEMYPLLVKYHQWWYLDRDVNGNGLCEYGSTDGTIVAARWESGMDNAIRFDDTKMVRTSPTAWSMDQESVDLNSFLFADKKYLAKIATELKKDSDAWLSEAIDLQNLVQENMYNSGTKYFHDIKLDGGTSILPFGPEGWTPLWSRLATINQAETVLDAMRDSTKFATFVPFPTVAIDSPEFSRGYWRGTVWLDQVYFAISAFNNYGYQEEAEALIRKVFSNAQGLMGSSDPIRENYWPLDGEGMRVNHFSWSAAHTLLLYQGLGD